MLDYWAVGLSGGRTIGTSDYRAVGVLGYDAYARCLIHKNTGADKKKQRKRLYVRRNSDLPLHIGRIHAFIF